VQILPPQPIFPKCQCPKARIAGFLRSTSPHRQDPVAGAKHSAPLAMNARRPEDHNLKPEGAFERRLIAQSSALSEKTNADKPGNQIKYIKARLVRALVFSVSSAALYTDKECVKKHCFIYVCGFHGVAEVMRRLFEVLTDVNGARAMTILSFDCLSSR
ncbi:hypothetical protein, partial [Rhizobium rhizogenes]|uniref:hypothetical protein n=1 Tax=Rhizobium rhizogenes TaxID=359 RepID=UPI001885B9DE